MKSYDWKYIFKKVVIFFIIFVVLSFVRSCKVKAAELNECVDSGTSVKGFGKIGTRAIASNYYYSFNNNSDDRSTLDLNFCVDPAYDDRATNGTATYNFVVSYCVNAPSSFNGIARIESTYSNYVDFTYKTNQNMYLDNYDWAGTGCYNSFIRLKLNYSDNIGNSPYNFSTLTDTNQVFVVHNNFGYGGILRYIDLIYYNESDYNNLLNQTKEAINSGKLLDDINGLSGNLTYQEQQTRDTITDDNVSGAESQVNDLLNNSAFQDSSGIQSIITAPLNFIQGLTNSCSPISLTIPFINTNLTIPCMKQELTTRVPTIVPILSTIINGFIIYRILIDIVAIVKSAREPDEDRIEVLDL